MAPPSSHRVDDPFDDDLQQQEAISNRNQERERASPSHNRQPSSQHYPPPGHHPYGLPPYYSNPMMYYPPHATPHDSRCHYCAPNYSHHQGYGQELREQLTPYNPTAREAQGNSTQQGMPHYQVQPHYVAVNVQNDVSQAQNQHQNQAASNKQVSLKQKVIHNTTKALDSILDRKVLLAALAAFVTPRFLHHLQAVNEKKKRKGITLNLGFGGF